MLASSTAHNRSKRGHLSSAPPNPHWPFPMKPNFFDIIGEGIERILQKHPHAVLKSILADYSPGNGVPLIQGSYSSPSKLTISMVDGDTYLRIKTAAGSSSITDWDLPEIQPDEEVSRIQEDTLGNLNLQEFRDRAFDPSSAFNLAASRWPARDRVWREFGRLDPNLPEGEVYVVLAFSIYWEREPMDFERGTMGTQPTYAFAIESSYGGRLITRNFEVPLPKTDEK